MSTTTQKSTISPNLLPFHTGSGGIGRTLTKDEKQLQELLLEGVASGRGSQLTPAYFETLRKHVRNKKSIGW